MTHTLTQAPIATFSGSATPEYTIVKGREAILAVSGDLCRLAEMCGQPAAMRDMVYFLSKPGLMRRTPQLMLIFRGAKPAPGRVAAEDLLGALLLYDYRMIGRSIGVYTTNDRSGRNTLVAPAALRSQLAEFAARALIDQGAHVVLISFREEAEQATGEGRLWRPPNSTSPRSPASRWARRVREIPEYLPLESTYDLTLANVRPKTRTNMRSYRRRAEKELGCTFVPRADISRAELLAFSREAMYAVPDKVAGWRYEILRELQAPLLMGMRDGEGRWLSLIGGRRFDTSSEILWQMNRDGLERYSLSLVMRGYFIEHEIQAGAKRFYLEGGTSHPISHSFVHEKLIDLAVLRRSPAAMIARKLARHVVPGDNELARMFSATGLEWTASGRAPATPTSESSRPPAE